MPRPRKSDEQHSFDPDIAREVLDRIAAGDTLKKAVRGLTQLWHFKNWRRCSSQGDERFVLEWLGVDDQLDEHYSYALELRAEGYVDEMDEQSNIRLTGDDKQDRNKIARARLRTDACRNMAEKLAPSRFGHHRELDMSAPVIIQISTTRDNNERVVNDPKKIEDGASSES